jgi:hypothetical protein
VNPASKYVETSQDSSPIHRYVSDHGEGVAKQDIEHVMIAGKQVALSDAVTGEERALITDAIQATTTPSKECFRNALKLWEYDNRFAYVEGFAVLTDLGSDGTAHAWCMLDGVKLVDVTKPFDHYHGVVVSDPEILTRYTEPDISGSGIIGNYKNRYKFLRERGYYE